MKPLRDVGLRPGRGVTLKKFLVLAGQIVAAAAFWIANYYYPNDYLQKASQTFFVLAVVYLVFKIILDNAIAKSVKDAKTRYSVRKGVSIIYIVAVLVALVAVWATNTEFVLVSFGLIAGGLTIALQDVIKNFVGGLTIFLAGLYKVGDRIEIGGRYGDVMDIGIMYTTLLETSPSGEADLSTGRLSVVPNGVVLTEKIDNSNRDYSYIWDEIVIPITYDSDWQTAAERFVEIAAKETAEISAGAETQLSSAREKYYLSGLDVEPKVYMNLTDNGINMSVRFTTDYRQRRALHSKLSGLMLQEIENSGGKFNIAVGSIDVTIKEPSKESRSPRKSRK